MRRIIIFSVFIIALVWGFYYLNFGVSGQLSNKTDVWGQFGDYVGGVLNPILSFITIYLLINSLSLQREANSSLISEMIRQEELEKYKKFELRFFHLIESQEKSFERLKIFIGDTEGEENDNNIVEYEKAAAVTYIENSLMVLIEVETDKVKIKEWLDDIDSEDCLFSTVRRFYLIVKLVSESNYDKDEYYELLINLTDIKIITLVSIAYVYFDWDIIDLINDSGVLRKDGIKEFIEKISYSAK